MKFASVQCNSMFNGSANRKLKYVFGLALAIRWLEKHQGVQRQQKYFPQAAGK